MDQGDAAWVEVPFPGGVADVGAAVPARCGGIQRARAGLCFGGGGGEFNLLPGTILCVVIAGRSGAAIRTPSYLISDLRCLCHNLKEN